jgi:hypothetical protein
VDLPSRRRQVCREIVRGGTSNLKGGRRPPGLPTLAAFVSSRSIPGAHGIVQGQPDGTYRPANEVTRDQMAVYVVRAFRFRATLLVWAAPALSQGH